MRRTLVVVILALLAGCTHADPSPSAATAPAGCARLTLVTDRATLRPHDSVAVDVALTNCGTQDLHLFPAGACFESGNLDVGIFEEGGSRYRLAGAIPSPADPMEGAYEPGNLIACSHTAITAGSPPDWTPLAPGATARAHYVWNGTVQRRYAIDLGPHGGSSASKDEMAPAGRLRLVASFGDVTAEANLTLDFPVRDRTTLLVADEWDWRNGTAAQDRPVACAPATFDGATLRVRGLPVDDYALLRRFANGTVAYQAWSPDPPSIVSPWNARATLAAPVPVGDRFWVNGTMLSPGDALTLRATATGSEHVLVLRDAGEVPVAREEAACPQ